MKTAHVITGVILVLLVGWRAAFGADSKQRSEYFTVRSWGKKDGLPGTAVNAILQSRDGYLWIGTTTGLFNFDGIRFTKIELGALKFGKEISITTLAEDKAGHLWVGSQNGLFCLADNKIIHYGKSDGLLGEEITSLCIDDNQEIWIGSQHGLNRLAGNHLVSFTASDGLPDNTILQTYYAHSGTIWITTGKGICNYAKGRINFFAGQVLKKVDSPDILGVYEDLHSNLWALGTANLINLTTGNRFNYFRGNEPVTTRVWSFCECHDGSVWIGAKGQGVFKFDGAGFELANYDDKQVPNDVRSICEDREGNLWLGLDNGLVRLQPQFVKLFKDDHGITAGPANCLAIDEYGHVNVGMKWRGLLTVTAQRLQNIGSFYGTVAEGTISALCAGLDGSLWFAAPGEGLHQIKNGRVLQLTSANGLPDDTVLALCTASDGAIWASTRFGGLSKYDGTNLINLNESDGLTGAPITCVQAAPNGDVWLGTQDGAVLREKQDRCRQSSVPQLLIGKPILSIYEDSNGRLWIGSTSGMACLDSGRSYYWGIQNGLPDEVVAGIIEDLNQNLWLLMGKGIYRLDKEEILKILAWHSNIIPKLVFNISQELNQDRMLGGGRAKRTADGRLWFATAQGLLAFYPKTFVEEKPPLSTYLESIIVNDQLMWSRFGTGTNVQNHLEQAVKMPANLQSIEFSFTSPEFTAPTQIEFRHKLEGFDPDWSAPSTDRSVRYGRLPDGRYEFKVAICNDSVTPSTNNASFEFIIPTPMWRTKLAIFVYIMTLVIVVVWIMRLVLNRHLRNRLAHIEQQQAMERERVRIAQNMHDEIGSKLTKISFMSECAKMSLKETGPAVEQISTIAHTARKLLQVLDEIVWVVNPRNDTLQHLAMYLAQYAGEYFKNTSIECELHVQNGIPRLMVPAECRHNLYLAFEELLSNVLKHSKATRVQIDIGIRSDHFQIHVNDNGCGFNTEEIFSGQSSVEAFLINGGNGLVNMRERMKAVDGSCVIKSQPGYGVNTCLSIPITLID